jgi:hypothetical protein
MRATNQTGMRGNNPAAAREALADLSRAFQGLIDGDAPRRIIRPGIAAGLRVLRDAIRAATPVDRRRVRRAHRRFARRSLKMPAHAVANAVLPQVSGLLRRSVGSSLKNRRGRIEGKAGLNVGKKPSKTPNAYAPHAHLVTLGTKIRFHKSGKNVGRMRPNRFVRRASAAAAGAARQAAILEIKRQIDRHFAKGAQFTRKQVRAINVLYSL